MLSFFWSIEFQKYGLLKDLKKVALDNNRRLVDLINEILINYVDGKKTEQINHRNILDELDDVKNRISILENSKN